MKESTSKNDKVIVLLIRGVAILTMLFILREGFYEVKMSNTYHRMLFIPISVAVAFSIYVVSCLYENIAVIKNTLVTGKVKSKSDEQ